MERHFAAGFRRALPPPLALLPLLLRGGLQRSGNRRRRLQVRTRRVIGFGSRAVVVACSSAMKPHISIFSTYFEGRTLASGVFEGRSGRLKRRFTVELTGRAEGNTLVLEEQFLFDDGERQERTWTLTRGDGQSFTGTLRGCRFRGTGQFRAWPGLSQFVAAAEGRQPADRDAFRRCFLRYRRRHRAQPVDGQQMGHSGWARSSSCSASPDQRSP